MAAKGVEVTEEVRQNMRLRLLDRLGDLGPDADPAARRRRVTEAAAATVQELAGTDCLARRDVDRMVAQLVDELLGLGAIESLVRDPAITEVMINGPERVYFEKEGRLHRATCRFGSSAEVVRLVDRVISPLGRRIDESSPMVDARLPDGSRLNAVIPPLALDGPSVTIRRFGVKALTVADLVASGTLPEELAERLRRAVAARKNILLSGGAGTGKTTLLNALSGFIPGHERIITIEDAAELRLQQEHVVRLEARPPNVEGNGTVSIRDLVRNALRMRPDRIIVGEVRGPEALDMLQAMNTGHAGSLATIHANSAYDALSRLETMVLMANVALPLRVVREQVAAAIDLVLHLVREPGGERQVGEALAVTGVAAGRYLVRRLVTEGADGDAVGQ
jgi:pilus assembly protein CpaF